LYRFCKEKNNREPQLNRKGSRNGSCPIVVTQTCSGARGRKLYRNPPAGGDVISRSTAQCWRIWYFLVEYKSFVNI